MSASSSDHTRRLRWTCLGLAFFATLSGCDYIGLGPTAPGPEEVRACGDGSDNDGNGLVDYPFDPGCESELDPQEAPLATPRACSDGIDNDNDGRVDFDGNGNGEVDASDDPGCDSAADDDESNLVLPECADGVDNDGDTFIDHPNDTGCGSRNDTSEM